ncbi:MAG: SH3 domain-containing protein [bacterium]|nr:SH3 domain-containing protein [bacterium]
MKQGRILAVLLLAVLALGGFSIVSAQSNSLDTVTTDRANMRSGPGTDFDLVTTLLPGTVIRLDGRNQNGNWVRGITAERQVGWVSSGLVDVTLAQLNPLPILDENAPVTVSPPSGSRPQQASSEGSTGGNSESAPTPAPQAAATSGGSGLLATATGNVNIRFGPGTSFRRAGGLNANTPFNIDGRNGDNTWVRGIDSRGTVGWVSVQFLNVSAAQVSRLPIVDQNTPFRLSAPGSGQQQAAAPAPAAPAAPAAPVANLAPVSGFEYGGHVASLDGAAIDAMRRAGMTWVKKQVRLGGGGGEIAAAHAAGFRILLGVVGDRNQVNSDGYLQTYASAVAGLAAAGADAIEIWNEPNIDREWAAPIDPVRYTELLRLSYEAIKGANPNTIVISGAPAPTGAEGAFPGRVMNDDRFLAAMAAAGAARYMDCVGAHYNEGIVPPTASSGDPRGDYYTRYLPSMINLYAGTLGKPVCFTELGYLTPEGYGQLSSLFAWGQNTTIAQQAAWLDGAVDFSRSSGRVRLVIVWNINYSNFGEDPMAGYAIIRSDGSCPACDALGR